MKIRCVVFDFDGTVTQVEEESSTFIDFYQNAMNILLHLRPSAGQSIVKEWEQTEAKVDSHPNLYGWKDKYGRIIGPAYTDSYVKARVIAGDILDRYGRFMGPDDRQDLLELLYQHGYEKAAASARFRPDTEEMLGALVDAHIPVFIVTNSGTSKVRKKFEHASDRLAQLIHQIGLIGDAQKFNVSHSDSPWTGPASVPESLYVEGLTRPLYLRRPSYLAALQTIWEKTGIQPAETLVCADIFELDLSLPAHLGTRIHLVSRIQTSEIDKRAVRKFGGTISDNLRAIADMVPLKG